MRTSLGTVLLGSFSSGTRRVIFSFLVVPVNSSFRLSRSGTSTVRGGRCGRPPPPNLACWVQGFGVALHAVVERHLECQNAGITCTSVSLLQIRRACAPCPRPRRASLPAHYHGKAQHTQLTAAPLRPGTGKLGAEEGRLMVRTRQTCRCRRHQSRASRPRPGAPSPRSRRPQTCRLLHGIQPVRPLYGGQGTHKGQARQTTYLTN